MTRRDVAGGEPRRPRPSAAGAALLLSALAVAGCSAGESAAEDHAEGYQPARVAPAGAVKQVTFTADAADRVDLRVVTTARAGTRTAVDHAALIYDGSGTPWVYTVPQPLTFVRRQVVVHRVDDGRALLSGVAPGTSVVTTGATEIYGTELDIAGSH